MTEPSEQQRLERQRRALTTTAGGAVIETQYQVRKTKAVAVSKGDIDELLSLDRIELLLMTVGQFFASGALWLFLDKYMDADFKWTALAGFCAASFIFGIVMVLAAVVLRLTKRTKVDRIFSEAE
ncbi:hypothetical protein MOP88_14010 [Sphingomonas sp. WKB10]|nr:hypothetical protein [Sphingomonas sp. WKB10]